MSPPCTSLRCLCGDRQYPGARVVESVYFGDNIIVPHDVKCDNLYCITRQREEEPRHNYNTIPASLADKIVERSKKEIDALRLKPNSSPAKFCLDEIEGSHLLGEGGFSNVFELISLNPRGGRGFSAAEEEKRLHVADMSHKSTNKKGPFAIKLLKPGLIHHYKRFANGAIDLTLEAAFLMSLDHPSILKIRGISADGIDGYLKGRHDSFFLIVDRLDDTLQDRVVSWRREHKRIANVWRRLFSKDTNLKLESLMIERLAVALDIASGLSYLHQNDLVYRDLKPSNIGFDLGDKVKLFDFGLCRELPPGADRSMSNVFTMSGGVGTYRYMSPEVAKEELYNQGADVFSFAMVLYEILSMNRPSVRGHSKTVDPANLRLCACWPESMKDILMRACSVTIAKRPTMQQICDVLETALSHLREQNLAKRHSIVPGANTTGLLNGRLRLQQLRQDRSVAVTICEDPF